MSTGAAGNGLLRGVFDGCLSGGDIGIKRRPYHKNCKCALHNSRAGCTRHSNYNNVTYPVRRSWSEGSLALMAAHAPPSKTPSPSCSPAGIKRTQTELVLCKEEDDDDQDYDESEEVINYDDELRRGVSFSDFCLIDSDHLNYRYNRKLGLD